MLSPQPATTGPIHRPMTSFIGREREIEELTGYLEGARLLTLTGTGGVGKTRLALEAAHRVAGRYPGGVWFVDLSSMSDPDLLAASVAAAVGVREEPGTPVAETLADYFQPIAALLILDNCEHIVEACAAFCDLLLRSCPGLSVLVTSRMPLGIGYEITWRVPSLSVPDPGNLPPLDKISQYEAIRLFVDRARLRRPDFALVQDNAAAVAQLCYRLDGLPLALELAAPRVRVLSVDQIVERLDERFRLLTSGSAGSLPRQQTLTALMDWSYELLSEPEKALLRDLSVFAGGFSLEAVEAVWGGEIDEIEVIDLITRLVDKSLITANERGGTAQYRMLETIRQYAAQKLAEHGDATDLHRRHRDWYMGLAEMSQMTLLSPQQKEWLDRMEWEHDNLRSAFAWSVRSEPESNAALRIAGALVWFWYFRGYLGEGRASLATALALPGSQARDELRAKGLNAAGALAYLQSDYEPARAHLEEALSIGQELDDKRTTAFALSFLGQVLTRQGDPQGEDLCRQGAAVFREIEDTWGLALALDFLGEMAWARGDDSLALQFHDESLSLYRKLGDKWGIALEISNFGRVALRRGDFAAARQRLEEALALQREVGDNWHIAWTLHNLGDAARGSGDNQAAARYYEESMALFERLGIRWGLASSLHMMGHMAQHRGDYARAATLFDDSLALFREMGDRRIIAHSVYSMADIARRQGDMARASALFAESLSLIRQLGDKWGTAFQFNWLGVITQKQAASEYVYSADGLTLCGGLGDRAVIAECLEWFGSLALEAGNYQRGGKLFGAAHVFREKIGTPPEAQMSAHYEKLLDTAAAVVGEKMLARYLAEGQNMKLDDAITLAITDEGETQAGKAPAPAQAESEARHPEDLTPREVEVLRLIAGGMTDARIADSLTLSSRTVQAHVRSIYAKLGVGNRSGATRWALDHGLA